MLYKNLLRPFLFRLNPELAHNLTHTAASFVNRADGVGHFVGTYFKVDEPILAQNILGLHFKNPVGLAAGFDKNGDLPRAMESVGFGFTEIGSITAQPSPGNPKPRVFRLSTDRALVNRMGLNNKGALSIINQLVKQRRPSFPVGINIAKTHNPNILGELAIHDYAYSYEQALRYADYITVNISCPNTEEGKTFENIEALSQLLDRFKEIPNPTRIPIFVKVSADLSDSELDTLLDCCESYNVDGYVATNTSSLRTHLDHTTPSEIAHVGRGGLSGRPLLSRSTHIVHQIAVKTAYNKPIIGVGGVQSLDDAIIMLKAGAWLLQVYTGLIYEGPSLPASINKGLAEYLRKNNLTSIRDLHLQ
jgi:dihydroorotate dehydrogenase